MTTVITSAENKIYKALLKLLEPRGIKKQERALVAGAKLVRERASERPQDCRSLIISERMRDPRLQDLPEAFSKAGRLIVLGQGLFRELDIFNTGFPLLEVNTPGIPAWSGVLGPGCTLALPFQDPANLGAVVRSAAAFGVSEIVLLREAAHPFHPKSIRASAGAVFKAAFSRGQSLSEIVKSIPARDIVALDMAGEPLGAFSFPESFLLLPGIEGQGLPLELRPRAVAIPMSGAVESLNAAAAAAIALFCWSRQLGAASGAVKDAPAQRGA